jgi:hypothetical protein
MLANAQASFSVPQLLFRTGSLFRKNGLPPSHKNSNNPLAVEPETENDAPRLIFSAAHSRFHFTSVEAAASGDSKKDLFK